MAHGAQLAGKLKLQDFEEVREADLVHIQPRARGLSPCPGEAAQTGQLSRPRSSPWTLGFPTPPHPRPGFPAALKTARSFDLDPVLTFTLPPFSDVPSWLKSLRLHKYAALFSQMSYEEMMTLTEQHLESQVKPAVAVPWQPEPPLPCGFDP